MLHDIANIEFRGLKKSDQTTQAYERKRGFFKTNLLDITVIILRWL